jgi:hypothetical protein
VEAHDRFYGKYRGIVVNDVDPMQQWRIQVSVPAIAGDGPIAWAMPCLPVSRTDPPAWTMPRVGSGVWVEFEEGDPDRPIWVGTWEAPPVKEEMR